MSQRDRKFPALNGAAEKLTNNPFVRLITPAGVVALAIGIFQFGGTVQSNDDVLHTICENTATTQAALHVEHSHATGELHRFRFLFPGPKGCPK